MISIHALREERDSQDFRGILHYRNFNPRAPRGARPAHTIKGRISKYFNPRAPRGARHRLMLEIAIITGISIHALREERDSKKTQNRRAFFVINIEYYESFR